MKPVVDCNCAMTGAARWIATSGRDGYRPGKDERLKSETLGSSFMLSLLNGYRARRSSTSLPGCIGRFVAARMAALDERFRLLTSAATDFQCFLQPVRVFFRPSPVAGNGSAGAKSRAKRTQMMAAFRTGKHRFSAEIRTFRSAWRSGENTLFCETNPNREKRDSAAISCKLAGYLKTI